MTETVIPQSTGASAAEAAAAGQQAFVPPQGPPPAYDERELPAGWIREFDPKTNRYFYVDTLAKPPKSVWVHPLGILAQHVAQQHGGHDDSDDDDDHPEEPTPERPASHSREKRSPSASSYPADVKRRTDEELHHASTPSSAGPSSSSSPAPTLVVPVGSDTPRRRSFIGRLKDGVFGTKEERKARRALRKARHREEERLYIERRNALMAQRQRELEAEREAYRLSGGQSGYYGGGQYGGGQYGYGAPSPNAYGGPAYNNQYGYGQSYDPYYNRRGGGGGLGLPLLGGLAGGLLLGDLLF